MRAILLASSGKFITDIDLSFLPKSLASAKIAYITTAAKGSNSTSHVERHRERMKGLGLDFEEIDIEGRSEQELREMLKGKDVIHVEGGNTFYLLKAVRESGFDRVIRELINNGVVYIGTSAGSYIACPTIEMATWKHQDKYDHYGVTDLTAMGLVPFLVTVHYSPEYDEALKRGIRESKYPVHILTDDQAILVQDERSELVGVGNEVKL